jgi:hypothetical protein
MQCKTPTRGISPAWSGEVKRLIKGRGFNGRDPARFVKWLANKGLE